MIILVSYLISAFKKFDILFLFQFIIIILIQIQTFVIRLVPVRLS